MAAEQKIDYDRAMFLLQSMANMIVTCFDHIEAVALTIVYDKSCEQSNLPFGSIGLKPGAALTNDIIMSCLRQSMNLNNVLLSKVEPTSGQEVVRRNAIPTSQLQTPGPASDSQCEPAPK